MRFPRLFAPAVLAAFLALPAIAADPALKAPQRNVVIFVADGLRYASVTPETAPTMYRLRLQGVDFANSHSTYPTLTTANASVIATGHYLGDTGNYANTMYLGIPIKCSVNAPTTLTFVEDDCILRQIKTHFGTGYMGQTTLLQAARKAGYNTVLMGKMGPAAMQFLPALDSKNEDIDGPYGVFIDDATNHPKKMDGTLTQSTLIGGLLSGDAWSATGTGSPPYPSAPNLTQQAYMTSVASQVLIPRLKFAGKPFVLQYWSRDPDTTQHAAHDSDGALVPGINGTDSKAAITNADTNLKTIIDALTKWDLLDNTDIIVIADHGFSTISHAIPNPDGSMSAVTANRGFLAIDIADWLGGLPLFDPDENNLPVERADGERPHHGSGLIGPSPDKPVAMVAANGGSDFVYVPEGPEARATVKRIFDKLIEQPYVGALFVNDAFLKNGDAKDFAGALPMSAINMIGAGTVPQPAIVVGFRNFVAKGCTLGEELCAVEIADTNLQTGQGMHGSFGRADTRNFMAAIGPSFKKAYVSKVPAGNVDVAPTIAHILGVKLDGPGNLKGRVLEEVFTGGKDPKVTTRTLASEKAANGIQTLLNVQEVGTTQYFTAGGIPGRTVGLKEK